MNDRESSSETIPDAFYDAIAYLIPGLNKVAESRCGISLGEWLVLWHLQRAGVQTAHSDCTVLRQELTNLLTYQGFDSGGISRILDSLERKQLVRRLTLTATERREVFGGMDGNKMAVVLAPAGKKKIHEFKAAVGEHFEQWRSQQPLLIRASLRSVREKAMRFVDWLLERQRGRAKALA
jgi:DNA-binding MarR family transcriptional regulator